jgi:hypothetical protein
MIPLYGFLEGDTIGLLVLAGEDMSLGDLARLLQSGARVRVRADGPVRVRFGGQLFDSRTSVRAAGLRALDRFDVVRDVTDPREGRSR